MTPIIPQIYALRKILQMIEREGKERHFELYMDRSLRIRKGVKKLGFTLFPKEGFESPTVNCINAAANPNGPEVYEKMRDKGFELAKGYDAVKNTTFRIGNMGYVKLQDINDMLSALNETVKEYG